MSISKRVMVAAVARGYTTWPPLAAEAGMSRRSLWRQLAGRGNWHKIYKGRSPLERVAEALGVEVPWLLPASDTEDDIARLALLTKPLRGQK